MVVEAYAATLELLEAEAHLHFVQLGFAWAASSSYCSLSWGPAAATAAIAAFRALAYLSLASRHGPNASKFYVWATATLRVEMVILRHRKCPRVFTSRGGVVGCCGGRHFRFEALESAACH